MSFLSVILESKLATEVNFPPYHSRIQGTWGIYFNSSNRLAVNNDEIVFAPQHTLLFAACDVFETHECSTCDRPMQLNHTQWSE